MDPVSVPGCATIGRSGRGDVVAARRGEVGHRRDDGTVLPRDRQFPPDQVRGDRRAAGAVDADDDGLDAAVLADASQGLRDGVGTRRPDRLRLRRCCRWRSCPPCAARRCAAGRPLNPSADVAPVVVRLEHVVVVPLHVRLLRQLVRVRETVHQPRLQRVRCDERPIVDEGTNLRRRLLPGRRDGIDELLERVAVERLGHLAMRGGVARLGEEVDRGLVVADVQQVGERADLVERAAEEDLVAGEAVQGQRTCREQEHAFAGGRDVVLAVAAVGHVGDGGLARRRGTR